MRAKIAEKMEEIQIIEDKQKRADKDIGILKGSVENLSFTSEVSF